MLDRLCAFAKHAAVWMLVCAGSAACSNASRSDAQQIAAGAAHPARLQWTTCSDVPNTQCAGLPVPIDPAKPGGGTLTLRIARVPAIDPSRKRGVLIFLPGGPGAGIVQTIAGENRKEQHVDELRRQYDVVTFDPRGIGESHPIHCSPAALPPTKPPSNTPLTPEDFQRISDANAA